MLRTIRDRVREQIAQGRSLEEVLDSDPTRGFGPGDPERFVRAAYNSMVSAR